MRKALIHRLDICVLLVFTGLIFVFLTACASSTESSPPVYAREKPEQVQGISAIHPRTPDAMLSFTQDDVIQYVNTHPMPRNLAKKSQVTIVQVKFLPSKVVSVLLNGENIGVPDDRLVCLVELQGTFTFLGPSGKTVTFQRGFEVFDAHTGNLLMQGGLEKPIHQ